MSNREHFLNEVVHPVRAIPILSFEVDQCFTEKEKEIIINNSFYEIAPGLPYISKSKHVLKTINLVDLNSSIQKYLDYYAQVIIGVNLRFKITNSWVTKNNVGTSHPPHDHTNSMLSAVMYYDPNKKEGELLPGISFKTSSTSLIFPSFDFYFKDQIISNTPYNQEHVTIKPKNNKTIIIFPSHIYHASQVNNTNSRYCLGVNSFVTGKIGAESNTNEINIQIS